MKRVVKWLGIAVVALLLIAAAALFAGLQIADRKMARRVPLPDYALAIPGDAASLARGRYLYTTRGCSECHGADGAGRDVINDGKGFHVRGPNISTDPGNVVGAYRPADWEHALRHGVNPGGRPLMVMPSEDYARWTDADLGALVGYVRSLPPVQGGSAIVQFPSVVRAMYGFGLVSDAAQKIDHSLPPSMPVPEGVTVEHGKYVVNMCTGCHGEHLSGGRIPGAPPEWPAAANLTPGEGSGMARYPDAEVFAQMFRSGKRPDGSVIAVMPFESLRELNAVDIAASYAYLKSLPPRAAGGR